jgi:hypothetical protein
MEIYCIITRHHEVPPSDRELFESTSYSRKLFPYEPH